MEINRKKISVFLAFALIITTVCCSINSQAFAEETVKAENTIVIDANDIDTTKKDEKKFNQYKEEIIDKVTEENCETFEDVEAVIADYAEDIQDLNTVNDKIESFSEEATERYVENKEPVTINVGDSIAEEYAESIEVADGIDLTIAPDSFIISEFTEEYVGEIDDKDDTSIFSQIKNFFIEPVYAASWTVKGGTARRALYSNLGKKQVTVYTMAYFQYNGSKAKYHSGFDPYYKRWFTTIKNSQWAPKRETVATTSYEARAFGVFYKEANGIVNWEKQVKAAVRCSKNGTITRSYYPAL